jgi:hypothetical protein
MSVRTDLRSSGGFVLAGGVQYLQRIEEFLNGSVVLDGNLRRGSRDGRPRGWILLLGKGMRRGRAGHTDSRDYYCDTKELPSVHSPNPRLIVQLPIFGKIES